jgi:hypothetical protein
MARNDLKRLMNSTYITWLKVCAYHHIPKDDWRLDGKYNVIRLKNGSTIDLLDVAYKPTDPDFDRFGSTEYSHGFGDEVQEWHFKCLRRAQEPNRSAQDHYKRRGHHSGSKLRVQARGARRDAPHGRQAWAASCCSGWE